MPEIGLLYCTIASEWLIWVFLPPPLLHKRFFMNIYIKRLINILVYRPLIRSKLKNVGKNFRLGYESTILTPQSFSIGENFFTGPYSYFSTNKETFVVIGDDVMFGPHCKMFGGNHNTSWAGGPMNIAPPKGPGRGIVIEDDVWIGAGVTLLDGAFISEGAVIAAGAVVNNKIPPYCIAGGIPARPIRVRLAAHELKKLLGNKQSRYKYEDLDFLYGKNFIHES